MSWTPTRGRVRRWHGSDTSPLSASSATLPLPDYGRVARHPGNNRSFAAGTGIGDRKLFRLTLRAQDSAIALNLSRRRFLNSARLSAEQRSTAAASKRRPKFGLKPGDQLVPVVLKISYYAHESNGAGDSEIKFQISRRETPTPDKAFSIFATLFRDQEVEGSNPFAPTSSKFLPFIGLRDVRRFAC